MSAPLKILPLWIFLLSFTIDAGFHICVIEDDDTLLNDLPIIGDLLGALLHPVTDSGDCTINITNASELVTINAVQATTLHLYCLIPSTCQHLTFEDNGVNSNGNTYIHCSGDGTCKSAIFDFQENHVFAQLVCDNEACDSSKLEGARAMDVNCTTGSCQNALYTVNYGANLEILNVTCNGNNTCDNLSIDGTNGQIEMTCNGENSCDNLSITTEGIPSLIMWCNGFSSCTNLQILEHAVRDLSLICYQDQSCNNAQIHCLFFADDTCKIDCLYGKDNCNNMIINMNPMYQHKLNQKLIDQSRNPWNMCSDITDNCKELRFNCDVASSKWIDTAPYCDNQSCCPWNLTSNHKIESTNATYNPIALIPSIKPIVAPFQSPTLKPNLNPTLSVSTTVASPRPTFRPSTNATFAKSGVSTYQIDHELLVISVVGAVIILCLIGCVCWKTKRKKSDKNEGQDLAVIVYSGNTKPKVLNKKSNTDTYAMQATTPNTPEMKYDTSIEIEIWLSEIVGLSKYIDNFISNGYDSMEMIKAITIDDELKDIGIQDQNHRNILLLGIQKLNLETEVSLNGDHPLLMDMDTNHAANRGIDLDQIILGAHDDGMMSGEEGDVYAIDWDTRKLIEWIVKIDNGRYRKYEEKLRSAFVEQEVTGDSLDRIEVQDLLGFGIVNFNDRKDLFQHIHDLVHSQKYKPQNEGR